MSCHAGRLPRPALAILMEWSSPPRRAVRRPTRPEARPGHTALRLADVNTNLASGPAVQYCVDRVRERSSGSLTVEPVNSFGNTQPDAEQRAVDAAVSGQIDLGWAGTQVFDTHGVPSQIWQKTK
jgi:hypothetical protein